ncbi:alanine/glycine:cation symporter family protein [Thioalkalivibrio paradoxus]|uniref:Sodium:alanine symporter n=1 Tax=Thioalkalivibrio paradoxus ARh 1 TaxID=713585 RepID=W0DL79_9GAMM|nr:sodium:alanine symporter family protein [Thioalkalivibrio paradoxus]AHE97645.1 sodium:alanine symporter [Thioalkalivibrio paradoxus ARh 1]
MIHSLVLFNDWLNSIVWGPPFMILLVGTGLYLTIRLGFFQFTHMRFAWRHTFGRLLRRTVHHEVGAITGFQAVTSAMAATIGVGNIAGVATAIALGGPGAVFWMWVVALVGMATKLGEATLGLKYRQIDADGKVSGGVFYYIEYGLGKRWKWLALLYAFLAGLAAFGIGNMVQANTMAHVLETGVGIPNWVTGLVIMVLVGVVTLGGIKRIAVTAERIVPTMAIIYVIGAIGVLISFYDQIPAAFGMIFAGAFTTTSAIGGFAGATVAMAIRYGFARGIFSNEAGLGSASIVHAQAKSKPYNQGLWGMWEVFIDTLVVCTLTALVILVTGVIQTGQTGAELTASAFSTGLPGLGGWIVLISIVLFSYSTMLTWNFYGEKSWEYAFGSRVVTPYRIIFIGFLFLGAIGGLTTIWDVADTLNGLMAAPNLLALILLAGVLAKEKVSYLKEMRERAEREKNGENEDPPPPPIS